MAGSATKSVPASPPDAHWLQRELAALEALANEYAGVRVAPPENVQAAASRREARSLLVATFERTAAQIASRSGVTACLVSHDGLVLARAGSLPDFDALAAVAQELMRNAVAGANTMALGRARQMVVVGDEHKLALFGIGPMVLSIICPRETQLGHVLRD